jgi:hypothetical protein
MPRMIYSSHLRYPLPNHNIQESRSKKSFVIPFYPKCMEIKHAKSPNIYCRARNIYKM